MVAEDLVSTDPVAGADGREVALQAVDDRLIRGGSRIRRRGVAQGIAEEAPQEGHRRRN
ncbi:MAG TPA: hypothetical protein VGE77_04430 [Nocardioides sp.]